MAAPQVGVLERLIVLDCIKEGAPQPTVMFNPEVLTLSDDLNTYEEGCLSIPEQFAEVTRPAEVRVGWIDMDGNPQEQDFDGLWATCVQHEIDHLDGVAFTSRMRPSDRKRAMRAAKAAAKGAVSLLPPPFQEGARRAKDMLKHMTVGGTLFEQLGFSYLGPIDGHDMNQLLPVLRHCPGRLHRRHSRRRRKVPSTPSRRW